jgi:predicted dithiol-disulfide oxidoreductase (DUF899 family)
MGTVPSSSSSPSSSPVSTSLPRLRGESAESGKLRAELLEAEIALKEQRERVAELRRRLPRDTRVEAPYAFREGPRDLAAGDEPVRACSLAGLFTDPAKPLVLVHFMFGGEQASPCPMCTLWADGYDGVVHHLEQHVNFVVVVAGDLAGIRAHARSRGWRNARLVSSQGTSFKRDFGSEDEDGAQSPAVSVFTLGDSGNSGNSGDEEVRHFYTGSALMGGGHFRGMDLLSPVWNFLDLTPAGRGDWFPGLAYED